MSLLLNRLRDIAVSPRFAFFTLFVVIALKVWNPWPVQVVQVKYYDWMMQQPVQQSEQLALADIGEKTLLEYGQYPFPRDIVADIIIDLFDAGAELVVMNIMFPEDDRFGGDARLAQVLESYPVVLSQTMTACNRTRAPPKATGIAVIGDGTIGNSVPEIPCVLANIPVLQDRALGVGMTATLPEVDGVVRRAPLLFTSQGRFFAAVSIEVMRVFSGEPSYQAKLEQGILKALRVPAFAPVYTDPAGRIFVSWHNAFTRVEVGDDLSDVAGKVVFLGATAAGIANPVPTPAGAMFPHDVQANVLQTMLDEKTIMAVEDIFIDVLLLIVLGSIIILTATRRVGLYVAVGSVIAIVAGSLVLLQFRDLLFDASYPSLALILVYGHTYSAMFVKERKLKQLIQQQFATYLSKELVQKLQQNPELLQLGGETKTMTFLFADIRGFTAVSEQYKGDPAALTELINRFLTPMTLRILESGGTIDKYMGDCIMAFWNAPVDVPNHEKLAIETSLSMMESLEDLNAQLQSEGLLPIRIGIGVNTGSCVVGNMGSDVRFDYSVLGDAVNLASRLEGSSKEYGVVTIFGEETVSAAPSLQRHLIEIDLMIVKGKVEPVRIFTYVKSIESDAIDQHNRFLADYRAGNWQAALDHIAALKGRHMGMLDAYYEIMAERIALLVADPPGDWDGVFKMTTK